MQIYQGISDFPHLKHAVVTSGTFDGVHVGHQKILERLKTLAQLHQGQTVVITFWPHPRLVLAQDTQINNQLNNDPNNPNNNQNKVALLNTLEEKSALLAQNGVDYLVVLPFTQEFSELSPDEFIQKIYIDAIQTKHLIIGYDHHFGKNREGNFEFLQKNLQENPTKYPFKIEEIPRQDIDNIGISSTKIRKALQEGNIKLANEYLGHYYQLTGKVVSGDKIGRTIGFPTANIVVNETYKIIPADGIYAAFAVLEGSKNNQNTTKKLQKVLQGMLYIGTRPSIAGITPTRRIELYIFDFDKDIYDEILTIFLVEKTREDAKFEGLEALKAQLSKDMTDTKKVLALSEFGN